VSPYAFNSGRTQMLALRSEFCAPVRRVMRLFFISICVTCHVVLSGCGRECSDPGTRTFGSRVPAGARLELPTEVTLLSASQRVLDFNTLPAGTKHEQTITLRNNGTTPVDIREIRTSCNCLAVEMEERLIKPAGSARATVRVDFASEPDYVGSLLLDARGLSRGSLIPAFVLWIRVEVQKEPRTP
jgi:hypothetical protein